jgi:hypothetical protein
MKKRKKKKYDPIKAAMTARRKAFFNAGGDLAQWRGRPSRFVDKKKKEEKNACRRKNISYCD